MPTEIRLLRSINPDDQSLYMTFSKGIEQIPDDPLFTYGMEGLGVSYNDLGEQPWIRFLAKTTVNSLGNIDFVTPNTEYESPSATKHRVIDLSLPPNVLLHPTIFPHVKEVLEHSIQSTGYKEPVWFINKLGSCITAAQLNEQPRN